MKKFLFTLIFVFFLQSPVFALNVEVLALSTNTKDNFVIKSKVFCPKTASKKTLYVMLHSYGCSSSDWGKLPLKLAKATDSCVLAVDLRGHGLSNRTKQGKIYGWQYLDKSAFLKYPNDVNQVIADFVKKYPQKINPGKIVFIGSDIGANTSILAASSLQIKPKFFVLISPSLNFKGLYIPIKLANLGYVKILGVGNAKDKFSIKGLEEVNRYCQGKLDLKIVNKGSCGMSILKANPNLENEIINWCKNQKI